jgi:hypothetical protein
MASWYQMIFAKEPCHTNTKDDPVFAQTGILCPIRK